MALRVDVILWAFSCLPPETHPGEVVHRFVRTECVSLLSGVLLTISAAVGNLDSFVFFLKETHCKKNVGANTVTLVHGCARLRNGSLFRVYEVFVTCSRGRFDKYDSVSEPGLIWIIFTKKHRV